MICIVDYGSGNIAALANLLKRSRIPFCLAGEPGMLAQADRFILPGVGAFDPTMRQLESSGIMSALRHEVFDKGKHVLGICVGMHLLGDSSEEGHSPGLGWIPGRVTKIGLNAANRIPGLPHMGWNSLVDPKAHPLLAGIDNGRGFYFLHSFFFDAECDSDVIARVDYGSHIPCAVSRGNVHGVQFHPEKSHRNGTRLLENFAGLTPC